jgi:uncharacterized membrane protein YgcG
MAEHRVTMLGGPLRRYEDPARSRDPRIREIVAALATVDPAPAPRAHFRAELRAQLVAVAPRLVDESAAETAPAPKAAARPARQGAGRSILAGFKLGRPLAAVACTVVVLALLLGGAVFISKKALPGDALYGIKRASENAQLALAQSPDARARLNLTFAGNRLDEVQDLLPKGNGVASVSPHVVALVTSTLSSADSDLMKASQTLGEQAVQNNSAAPLETLTNWAPGELTKLNAIMQRLPAGPARDHVQTTYALLSSAMNRAAALQSEVGCSCLHSTPSDDLGPIPCSVCTLPTTPAGPGQTGTPVTPGQTSTTPGTTTTPIDNTGTIGGGVVGGSSGGSSSGAPSTGSGGQSGSASPTQPVITLPSVSLPPLPSASIGPIGVGSCGVSISLSPINLHLGGCKPSHS